MPINPNNLAATATMTFDDEFATMPLSLWNGTSGTWSTTFIFADPNGNGSTLPSNGEQEWYINNNYAPTASVVPWYIANGVLNIVAQPASASIQPLIDGYQYTSGLLETSHSFSQTYGFFQISAEVPSGQGLWPAFWLLPQNGDWPPELDAMEILGSNTSGLYTSVHSTAPNTPSLQSLETTIPNASQSFNTYGIDWEPDYITWYFDGQAVYRVATPADLDTPMYMLLNLAVGGYFPGDVNSSTTFPADLQVQWVRAYQSVAGASVQTSPSTAVAATGSGTVLTASGASVALSVGTVATSAAMLSNGEVVVAGMQAQSGEAVGVADLFSATGASEGAPVTLQQTAGSVSGLDPQVTALQGGLWEITYAGAGAPVGEEVYTASGSGAFFDNVFVTNSPVFAALGSGGYVETTTTWTADYSEFLLVDSSGKDNWIALPTNSSGTTIAPTTIEATANEGFLFSYTGLAQLDWYSFNGGVHTTLQLASVPTGALAATAFSDLCIDAAWVGAGSTSGTSALMVQGFGPAGAALGSAVTLAASVDATAQVQVLATGVVDNSVVLWSTGGEVYGASFNGVNASGPVQLAPGALSGVSDAVLNNGDIALSWVETDNGVQNVWAEVLNPTTMQVTNKQALGAGSGSIHLVALPGGGFAESWHNGSVIDGVANDGLGDYGAVTTVSGDFLGVSSSGQVVAVGINSSGQATLQDYALSAPAAPAPTITSAGGLHNKDTQVVTGTGQAGTQVTLYDSTSPTGPFTTVVGHAMVNTDGDWTAAVTFPSDGVYYLEAADKGSNGQTGVSPVVSYTIDTHAAVASFSTFSETPESGGYSLSLTGTATDLAPVTLTIYEDGTKVGTVTPTDGTWSFTDPTVTNADHIFTLKTADAAGNDGSGTGELLLGTSAANTLVGGAGNNIFYGAGGDDTLIGGSGANTYVYKAASEAPVPTNPSGPYDTITNFKPATDHIDLSALGDLTYGGETQSMSANQVDWYVSGGATYVIADVTGSSHIDMIIKLDGVKTLSSSDFILA